MYVPDASIWVARFWLNDPRHDDALAWVTNVIESGTRLLAPTILLAEVAGSVARRTGDYEEGLKALRTLEDMSYERSLFFSDVGLELGRASANVAARIRLRGMDAIYVATAQYSNFTLVTLDNEQRERASQIVPALTLPRHT